MYDENKQTLEELRSKNQEVVDKEFDKFVKSLKYDIIKEDNKNNNYSPTKTDFLDKMGITENKDIFYQIIIYFAMIVFAALMLFPNYLENIPIFIFGIVFFAAGFNIGTSKDGKGVGIIFFFSHGGTGFALMLGSLIAQRMNVEVLTDLNGNMRLYLALTVAILIVTVFSCVIYNLSDTLKESKKNKVILLLLFFIVLVLTGFLPIIH